MSEPVYQDFIKFLSVTAHPGLKLTGDENYAGLAEGNGAKLAVAKARLPVLFKEGFNTTDTIHLQQVRHRLDTAVIQLKNLKDKAGRKLIVITEAWDAKMPMEAIKIAVDAVYPPGAPLEVDAFWCAETHAKPARFVDVTPNRPKVIPIKTAGPIGGHKTGHEHHSSEGECCGG